MIEEQNILETNEVENEYKKLMSKSLKMIISFFSILLIGIVLFIILQRNKFFIFNMNRTFDNVPSPFMAEIFSLFFFVIIIVAIVSFIVLWNQYLKSKNRIRPMTEEEFSGLKKAHGVADIFSVVPIFLVIVMIINGFFFSIAKVYGISMEPTFYENDAVIIKYVDDYNIDDIVIVDNDNTYIIKRLIAKSGDHLVVNDEGVFVNGDYIESVQYMGQNGLTMINYVPYDIIIPEGNFYVLGDNEYYSSDSRSDGLFSQDEMIGIVIFTIPG